MTAPAPARSPWRIYGLLASATVLATLNFSLIFVAFSEISEAFDASDSTISWALTGFTITTAAVIVPGGWLADRFGRSRVFLGGFAVFIAGSAFLSIAPTVELLIAARVVQATGLAIQSPAALAIVLEAFPLNRRSMAVGAMGAAGGVSAAIGPLVGGALIDQIGWRWSFFLNVPVGVAVFVLVASRLPPDRVSGARTTPDVASIGLLMAGIGALALGIVQSDDWGFADPRTIFALIAAAALISVLIVRSARHDEPILYLPLFANHDFSLGAALAFLVSGSFAATFFAFIRFLIDGWDLSLFRAGLLVGLIPAIGGPMSVVSGRIADRWGHRRVILPGSLLVAAGGFWMWAAVSAERDIVGLWVPAVFVYGLGVGFGHAAIQAAALSTVPEDRLAIGSAMIRIFQEIGATVSTAVVIALFARASNPVDGLRATMIMLMVASLLSVPMAASLRNRGHGSLDA